MADYPKFMIAENPMADRSRVFILHTQGPRILAEAFHFDKDQEVEWMNVQSQFETGSRTELPDELIAIGALWIADTKPIDPDRLAGTMRRMADWYRSYCIWED